MITDRKDQIHPNGEPVALVTVLPFVQFVVKHGHAQSFCFEALKKEPSRAHGIAHLTTIANKLPVELRAEAVSLIERNTHEAPVLVAA